MAQIAQTEDTELRDLVIEALEKNGSLAKIRALLRANIFLAFEDECENMRQNVSLDNLMKLPEGVLALSIVHEFLESCNLKNTLFVYKSESRQGKDYKYYGKKHLADKMSSSSQDNPKEPILVTLIRNLTKPKTCNQKIEQRLLNKGDCGDNYKDEQNNSYIVHEDSQSSAANTSQSDNSMDEKNKLHLRLQLDNSDTDTSTSTDSTRDKSSSEYIPSDHVLEVSNSHHTRKVIDSNEKNLKNRESTIPYFPKLTMNNSSDSTSYVDLKPYSSFDEKALNTMGIPYTDTVDFPQHVTKDNELKINDSAKSATLSSVSSLSLKNESPKNYAVKSPHGSSKSDGETDYTYDFTTSQGSKNKVNLDKTKSPKHTMEPENKNSPVASPNQNSQSSVSISDVADLISEKSSSFEQHSHTEKSLSAKKKTGSILNKHSDDSGDFTESPIPSLSNLSLDIHSD